MLIDSVVQFLHDSNVKGASTKKNPLRFTSHFIIFHLNNWNMNKSAHIACVIVYINFKQYPIRLNYFKAFIRNRIMAFVVDVLTIGKKKLLKWGQQIQPPYKFGIVHFYAHICCHPSDIFHVCSNSITVLVCMNILYTVRTQLMCLSLFWHWFNDGKDCCKCKWKLVRNLGERLCSASLHILKRVRNYIE